VLSSSTVCMLLTCEGFPMSQVFIMTGWYPDVAKALFERGWKQVGAMPSRAIVCLEVPDVVYLCVGGGAEPGQD
jgi:hypothetical protein